MIFASQKRAFGSPLSCGHKCASAGDHRPPLQCYREFGETFTIKRNMPNALVLDMCMYRLNGSQLSEEMQVWQAQCDIRKALDMRQVFGNGIPQRYKWVNMPHPNAGTKVELHFTFHVEEVPKDGLCLAVESAANFNITLNGVLADMPSDEFYIDKSINIMRLNGAREGFNTLVLACEYKNSYELEDCYIIGNFGVDANRCIIAEPTTITLGDWCQQGLPHYPGAVVYEVVAEMATNADARYFLRVGEFSATVISVRVNGKNAGYIPWKCANVLEITEFVESGMNQFEIEVTGSPRNLFGPFHLASGDPLVTNWNSFRAEGENYTERYNLKPYGLFGVVEILHT